MPKIFNQQKQKLVRRKLRQALIGCEIKLWGALRRKNLGYRFHRQYGIGKFVVDFYCPKLKLVIEIDGATHSTETEIASDAKRQKYLEDFRLTVKRYNNVDVINNFSEIIYDIQEMCEELRKIKNKGGDDF